MRTNLVLTLTGRDRIGIVDDLTRVLLGLGGNVETSRMARLGGEFAILMLVSLPAEALVRLEKDVQFLTRQGYRLTTSRTEPAEADTHPGWLPFRLEVHGADHEGIVHEIAHYLSQRGIHIESMDTGTTRAPVSGTPLFALSARIAVPPELPAQDWEGQLQEVARRSNVEVVVAAAEAGE